MFGNLTHFRGALFDDFRRLEEEMDEILGRWPRRAGIRSAARGAYPPINVAATTEQVVVYLFAAGLDPESVDLSLQQNILTMAGERSAPPETDANYYRKERFDGPFRRVVTLPEDIDPDRVDASYANGVLQVRVQRRGVSQPRQISID